MIELVSFALFSYMGINNESTIIRENALKDAKPADDVVSDEISYTRSTGSYGRRYFIPLSIAFSRNKDPYVASWRWVDKTNEVEGPDVKLPRGIQAIYIAMELTRFAYSSKG